MTIPHEPARHDDAAGQPAPQPFGVASAFEPQAGPRFVSKPGTVRWGLGILWVGVVLTVILAFLAALLLASVGADAGSSGDAALLGAATTIFLVVGLAIVVVQGVLLVFAGRGRNWARIALAVVSGLSLLTSVVSGDGINVGSLLTILAVVLLFLPASNAWFDAQAPRTQR